MRKLLVGLAVLLLAGPAAMATVTTSASEPTGAVIETHDAEPLNHFDVMGFPDDYGKFNELGSTFPGGFTISAVAVQHRNGYELTYDGSTATSPTAHVGIFTATDWLDRTTYSLIGSGSGAMPSTMDDPTYITVELSSPVVTAGGTTYGFLFTYWSENPRVLDRVTTGEWDSNRYADGGLLTWGSEGGVADGDYFDPTGGSESDMTAVGVIESQDLDMTFWLIPEPATLTLLGLGGLGMLIRRRR